MSRKKTKSSKKPAKPVANIERATGFSGWFFFRWALAAAIIIASVSSVRFAWQTMMADSAGQKGFMIADQKPMKRIGLSELRSALNRAPFDPITQYRVANVIIQLESQKLVAQDYSKVNINDLREARGLLMESRKGRNKPQVADLRLAHTEALMAEYYRQVNEAESMRLMSNEAARHFAAYRQIQGRPDSEPGIHYKTAMEHSMVEPYPQLALEQYDDLRYYYGGERGRDSGIEAMAVDARLYLGEFHLMMLNLSALVAIDPHNPAFLEKFETLARMSKQEELGAKLLESLEIPGDQKARVDALIQRLRT